MSKTTLFTQGIKISNNINVFKAFLCFLRFLDTLKLELSEWQNQIPKGVEFESHERRAKARAS